MFTSVIYSSFFLLPLSTLAIPHLASKRNVLPGNHSPKGSAGCTLYLGGDDDGDELLPCSVAPTPYDNSSWYHGYTSYTYQNCAAMVRCNSQASYDRGLSGAEITRAFNTMTNVYQYICGSQQLTDPNCWVILNYCSSCKNTKDTNTTGKVIPDWSGGENATMSDILKEYPNATNYFIEDTYLYLDITPKPAQVQTS